MKRSIVGVAFLFSFVVTSVAHADTTVPLQDPLTDVMQLWSGIASEVQSVAQEVALTFEGKGVATSGEPASSAAAVNAFEVPQATSSPSAPQQTTAATSTVINYITNPIERVVDEEPPASLSFVTQSELAASLLSLSNSLDAQFTPTTTPAFPQYIAGNGNPDVPYAAANNIGQLSNVTISNPTISGGSIPASSITGDITTAINTATGEIDSLTGTGLTYVAATTTDATSSNLYASSFSAGTIIASGTTTLSLLDLANLNCATYGNGGKLTTDANGTVVCAADQGGSGSTVGGSDTQVQFNSGGSFAGSSAFTFASSTNLLAVTNASTTNLSAGGEGYFATASTTNLVVSSAPSGFLQTNAQGLISATSTLSATALFGTLGTINGTALPAGDSITITAASSTLLTDSNTFSGNDTFSNAIAGNVSGNAGTATALQNARTINGVSFNGTANIVITAASSTLLANNNSWTGLDQFANASTTLGTISTLWLPNVSANSLAYLNGSNQVAAASVSYPVQFSGGSVSLAFGTTTANAWSQLQTLQSGFLSQASSTVVGTLTLTGSLSAQGAAFTGSSGTTTIASGQGFTVGGSQFVVQQGSGNVGIGTTMPSAPLSFGTNTIGTGGQPNVIRLYDTGSASTSYGLGISAGLLNLVSGGSMALWADGNEAEYINSSGNVGIGTTSPANSLDVEGTGAVTTMDVFNDTNNSGVDIESRSGYALVQGTDNNQQSASILSINPFGGNIGIGTTTPDSALDIYNNNNAGGTVNGVAQLMLEGNSNNVGVQLTNYQSGGRTWAIVSSGENAAAPDALRFVDMSTGGGTDRLVINSSGNVGIGTTSPSATLAVSGSAYVTGNLTTQSSSQTFFDGATGAGQANHQVYIAWDGSSRYGLSLANTSSNSGNAITFYNSSNSPIGSISVGASSVIYNTTSDLRLKENIATTTEGLAALMQIPVVDFNFINDPTQTRQQGFIAQWLYPIYPEAVATSGTPATGPLGTSTPWEVDYGRLTPLIVSAVQDIANISSTFEQNLIAWLGNAQNGIQDLYASIGNFGQVNTNDLCVGTTCVTPAQFQAMVAAAGQTTSQQDNSGTTTTGSDATDTPPVIQINGDNPAIVQVGATYSDLGTTITGPQADLNLGIQTFVNGSLMSPVVIDTSSVATDTIEYVVTDQNGLSSTSTRTVIIEAPSIAPSDDASSTVATSTDATTTDQ